MDEKEKQIIEDYKSNLELYKYEKKIGLGRINIDEKIYGMEVIINVIERLQKENEELKNIRYDTPYGTETIHLIPESNLIEINTQKYMIEVEPGKFVDLKQVYLENKKLNEYKENYISVEKIKTELTELKKEYVHIQEIKREKGDFGEEKSKIQTVLLYKIEALQDLLN